MLGGHSRNLTFVVWHHEVRGLDDGSSRSCQRCVWRWDGLWLSEILVGHGGVGGQRLDAVHPVSLGGVLHPNLVVQQGHVVGVPKVQLQIVVIVEPSLRTTSEKELRNLVTRNQEWSLTQFYSVEFSQSRIGVKKCGFNKRTIKVCVSCF